ncbi:unnamed protein product [Lampetra planeri]
MENSSSVVYLATFQAPYLVKVVIFSLCVPLFVITVVGNLLVLVTVAASRNLHKPMHIFLCNLVVNDAIGCTSSVPKQLHIILTGDTQIFYSSCIVQMFWIHFFSISEIFTLTAMAYDRYLAVCYPLRYHAIITNRRAVIATIVICTLAAVIAGSQTILIIPLKLKDKDRQVDGIHCDNMGILQLSASDTRINESYGSALIVIDVVALGIIGYTYFKIIVECKKSRLNQARNKSLETLITHFLALSIFFVAIFVAILVPRFIKKTEDSASRNIKSTSQLAVFVVPIANVTIYLFRTKALKKAIVFHCHRLMLVFHLRLHKVQAVEE